MSPKNNDLDHVYAEIQHHLNNVLADETIKTIIQILKDYPVLRARIYEVEQQNKQLKSTIDKIRKSLHDYYDDVGNKTFMEFTADVKDALLLSYSEEKKQQ